MYGRHQFPDKLIPKFIISLLNGEQCTVHGDGSAKRTFIHVEDSVRAFETVMLHGKIGAIYNIGAKTELSVMQVLQRLVKEIKHTDTVTAQHVKYVEDRKFNDKRYSVEATALEQLGWTEKVPFEEGLKKTIEWYRQWTTPATSPPYYLCFGLEGWIGQQFKTFVDGRLHLLSVPKQQLRAEHTAKVEEHLMECKSKYGHAFKGVLSFVGRTSGPGYNTIDYLEDPKTLKENVCDNLFAPISLALLCQKHRLYCMYLGTGCIFYGGIHDEAAAPNFFGSAYSVVKGFTDRLMHQLSDTVLNVRIRMPISLDEHPRDFITKIRLYAKVIDVPNSVSVLPTLFPALLQLILAQHKGTINLVNPGVMSHVQVLEMYKKHVQPDFVIRTMTLEEQRKLLKADRSNNHLDTTLLQQLCPAVASAREAITHVLQHRAHLRVEAETDALVRRPDHA